MIASFLTALLFALSVAFAARSARIFGGAVANLGRMVIALVLLGFWAEFFGQGLRGQSLPWFIYSGVIGFGLGDVALFLALTRIGPRLTILLTQCLAAPFGALMEWLWLGTSLRPVQLVCGAVILCGVALALAPGHSHHGRLHVTWAGVIFGAVAAIGQAGGAVISRKAYAVARLHELPIDGLTAAFQRMLGGIVTAVVCYAVIWLFKKPEMDKPKPEPVKIRRNWIWILLHALCGPVLGVGCYQWAL
ncbi:MAG: DMT family transporter, partial [Verrucomicrobiota bacterium]